MTHAIAKRLLVRADMLRQDADRLAEEAERLAQDAAEVQRLADAEAMPAPPAPVDPPPPPPPEPAPAPPPPPPEPAPVPAPPPAPSPAPVQDLTFQSLGDGSRLLTFGGWHQGGATYIRGQSLTVLSGPRAALNLHRTTKVSGSLYLPERNYPLFIGGKPAGLYRFPAGVTWAQVTFDAAALPPGWQIAEVGGTADGEFSVRWHVYVDHGQAKPDWTPVHQGSHLTPTDPTGGVHAWTIESATYTPTITPLARREHYPDVRADTRVHADLVTRGERSVNITLPCITTKGLVCTHNQQSYFWYSQLDRWPSVALLNGPRGFGVHPLTTHIEVGRAAPDGRQRHTFYFSTPWSIVRGEETGNTVCLVGYEHEGMASYAGDGAGQATLRLRGDWSAVPADRRGLWGVRSFCWDEASLAVDESLPRIPGEDGAPHPTGPVMYVAEQRESGRGQGAGRVLRVEFSAKAHGVPPIVTEFATDLAGPWGIADYGDEVIVSERNASRIVAIHKATGTRRVLAQGDPALTPVGQSGQVSALGTLAERRALPCCAPECLKIQDGRLYIGSYAAESVTRLDLTSDAVDPDYLVPVRMARQSWFVDFALSDGSFGPRGTVYAATWGQSDYPAAYGIQPDGGLFTAHAHAAPWAQSQGYPCAVAVGIGRIYVASSNWGITRFGAAMDGDVAPDANLWRQGEYEWDVRRGNLLWGSYGFGNHGRPLPWGETPAIDHMLTILGHQRPA